KPYCPGIPVIARGTGLDRSVDGKPQQVGTVKFSASGFRIGEDIGDGRTDLGAIHTPTRRCGCHIRRYDPQGLKDALAGRAAYGCTSSNRVTSPLPSARPLP